MIPGRSLMEIDDKQKARRRKLIKWLTFSLVPILLGVCFLLAKSYLGGKFNSIESFQSYMEKFGIWGPLALTAFQFLQVVLPVLPGFLGCIVGAIMFGPFVGFMANYIGISLGSIAAFLLARKYGRPLIEDLFPQEKYRKWSDRLSNSKSYVTVVYSITDILLQ